MTTTNILETPIEEKNFLDHVTKLRIEPGDILVIRVSQKITTTLAEQMRNVLEEFLHTNGYDNRVLVIDQNINLETVDGHVHYTFKTSGYCKLGHDIKIPITFVCNSGSHLSGILMCYRWHLEQLLQGDMAADACIVFRGLPGRFFLTANLSQATRAARVKGTAR